MTQINQAIMRHHHITLCVGTAQQDYDFHTKVLSLKSVKKTLIYDGMAPFYHLYYGNDLGEESTLITCFPVAHFGRKGHRGSGQIGGLALSVPESAIPFWERRLAAHGFDVRRSERFGEQVLSFAHPCGIPYELIGIADDERKPYSNGEVPAELAIRGLHTIGVNVRDMEASQEFMQQGWSAHEVDKDGKFSRYAFGDGGSGKFVDYALEPDMPQASWTYGEGIVHHCAFQVADRSVQDRVKANLEGLGFTDTSERKDRGYFESIYVRTPSGAMFEATVSKPDAFLIDEPYEKMGQTVQLAPQFESQRAVILESLEALNY
ncbi:VOC family protein [Burkholderia cenocepacia]|jgi:glyoxalase family protein|uniref:VOC family protein n=1 Tax=Burkholderia TaxID=32008 RepID=UPI0002343BA5|nr:MULTISPECIES: VOC family protein [Burkholderia]AQQ38184.1 glyoxalase [Burkholderia cenocepacia]MBG0875999.1 VOC family protein [Burkholderia sp. 9775_39]MBG0884889.1 VOC family protein [Burkholderia sp. 9773_38]MBR8266066.1 VOC family protein [Burkholderia cenocepacia]MCL4635816.1 VOC family protein [Burkholderia sp.]